MLYLKRNNDKNYSRLLVINYASKKKVEWNTNSVERKSHQSMFPYSIKLFLKNKGKECGSDGMNAAKPFQL